MPSVDWDVPTTMSSRPDDDDARRLQYTVIMLYWMLLNCFVRSISWCYKIGEFDFIGSQVWALTHCGNVGKHFSLLRPVAYVSLDDCELWRYLS